MTVRPAPGSYPLQIYYRGVTALAVAHVRGANFNAATVAAEFWPRADVEAINKAAVSPASTGAWGSQLAATGIGPFLRSLRPRSAAARLFAEVDRVPMGEAGTIGLPGFIADFPAPAFVAEGSPIPAVQGSVGGATLGPRRKMAFIAGLTGELNNATGEAAEQIIRLGMEEATARALDSALFSDAAANETRPAGLLNGVTPIAPAAGGGLTAMAADLKELVGALADAGGGANVMVFANPRQALAIQLLAGPGFTTPVVPTPALPPGTLVALEVGAFATGFSELPEVTVAKHSVIHWEDANPAPIGTSGAPATVAAPSRSGFQSNTLALRVILRAAWTMRGAGLVQVVTGATW